MEKKQSSVEWLALWVYNNTDCKPEEIKKAYQEAKAMHEQEHENAFFEGAKCFREGQAWTEQGFREISHIVYSETFGKSEQ